MKLRRLAILCGHHGVGTGAVGNGLDEFKENAYCSAATLIKMASEDYDIMVVCDDDVYERKEMYEHWNPDVIVSIHHNAVTETSAHGAEICYFGDKSEQLALCMEPCLRDELGMRWRGLKRRPDLVVLQDARELGIPAVLVEGGFLSNFSDSVRIAHPTWPNRVAEAIYGGLTAYFTAVSGG